MGESRFTNRLLVWSLALVMAACASATLLPTQAWAGDAGNQVSIQLGANFFDVTQTYQDRDGDLDAQEFNIHPFASFNLFAGYGLGPIVLGGEFGYHAMEWAPVDDFGIGDDYDFYNGTLSVLRIGPHARFFILDGKVRPYIGVGASYAHTEFDGDWKIERGENDIWAQVSGGGENIAAAGVVGVIFPLKKIVAVGANVRADAFFPFSGDEVNWIPISAYADLTFLF